MVKPVREEDAAAVPDGRLARFLRLGGMTTGLIGGMAVTGARHLAQGKRPSLQDLVMTPSAARRITHDLRLMRGAAMKMGQIISMDPGFVLPPEMTAILSALREEARHMPPAQLREVLDKAWGPHWRQRFVRFDVRPFAAASIGQVHRAQCVDGRDLAIKVQYPAVRASIDSDIDNIGSILRLSGMLPRGMDIAPLLDEARRQLHEEADYIAEAGNLRAFGDLLRQDEGFALPGHHPDLSTGEVLAMDYLQSDPLDSLIQAPQALRDSVAARLITLVLQELFVFGRMQTDPNLANYRYDAERDRVVLLDFGAVMPIDPNMAHRFRCLLGAALDRNRPETSRLMAEIGYFGAGTPATHQALIVDMFELAMTPLRQSQPFDFATSTIVTQLRDMGIALGRDRDLAHVPPAETLFLHRKIGGIYLVAAKLKAQLHLQPLVAPYR